MLPYNRSSGSYPVSKVMATANSPEFVTHQDNVKVGKQLVTRGGNSTLTRLARRSNFVVGLFAKALPSDIIPLCHCVKCNHKTLPLIFIVQ